MVVSSLTNFKLPFLNSIANHTPKPPQRLNLQLCSNNLRVSSTPTSKPSPSPPQNTISKFLIQRTVTLLLGSLVFAGSSRLRPVIAQPVQETDISEQTRFEKSSESEEEAMCVKLVQEDPKNVDALKMVVNVKMKSGKSEEAVEYVERLIKLQPNEMEWRLLQALCYELMGDYSKAKSLLMDILKQKPLLLRALHGVAMVMHKNHEGPAVFVLLERALKLARRTNKVNEERNIRILIAQMHIVKGDLEQALENFQDLIDENPRDFRPYLCQGIVYSLLDMKKEAEDRFEIFRGLVPEEFPERGFLDDVVLAAKTESRSNFEKGMRG